MKLKMLFLTVSVIGLISCQTDPMPDNPAHNPSTTQVVEAVEKMYSEVPEIMTIEHAHAKEQFLKHDSISFRIDLEFGGTPRLNGTIVWSTNSGGGSIIKDDGEIITVNGYEVTSTNAEAKPASLRFAGRNWRCSLGLVHHPNQSESFDSGGCLHCYRRSKC